MKQRKLLMSLFSLSAAALLAACSTDTNTEEDSVGSESVSMESMVEESSSSSSEGMGDMVHDDSGVIPDGLMEAENPTYKVEESVIMQAGHMEGMEGAEATIVGAFDTVAYEVSYDPTNGDPRVENHQWVIQEEIMDAGTDPFGVGSEVMLGAEHMEGMNGATATIDAAEMTTVYIVDYTDTVTGETIKNHKWVIEQELAPVEAP
ncbi:MAG: YdhK family protein [Trichococcus flocculiformis]|uniref:YdhK family protein n=1 Tax=Trichococcus flocculiformis TaxID=82803 RepID=A0A847D2G9_9LACT|nr:YdhK family protein [Trichococcus flocculiformis]NLD31009.1 YdhK family protein [Trichococcus flocculiformis]